MHCSHYTIKKTDQGNGMCMLRWIGVLSIFFSLIACSSHHQLHLLGYVEGRYVYLSSPVSGRLIQLAVQKGETITANQLAFQLDPEPELSQLKNAESNLILAQKMLARNQILRKTAAIGEATLDASVQQYESAAAQVNQYQWMVNQKTIYFSKAGYVQDTLFRQNEFVPAGKPIIAFLPPENRILVFFVPEKNLSSIQSGETIHFTCDGCQKNLSAKIDYISSQAEYTPPVIYSIDSREKLVYWVEAKINSRVIKNMNPGEPVEVTLDLDMKSHHVI